MKKSSRMCILSLVLALCSIAFIACEPKAGPASAGPKGEGGPKLEIVGGDTVDWGTVSPAVLQREMKITNTGGDTLHIKGVNPSCGCTTAPLDKSSLAPGDTATVKVSLDVATSSGEVHKNITVTSDDSTRPNVVVFLKANLVRDLVVEPVFFPVIQSASVGREDSTYVSLKNTSTAPITIQPPIIYDAAEMAVRFGFTQPVVLQPGDSTRVVAYVKPLKQGMLSTDVVVNNSSKASPELKLKLTTSANTGI